MLAVEVMSRLEMEMCVALGWSRVAKTRHISSGEREPPASNTMITLDTIELDEYDYIAP